MTQPAISLIIPIYNVEQFLQHTLESVQNQTWKDFEALCINDGSLDGSAEIIKKFAQQDERFKFIDKENGGLSSARNLGLQMAAGEYVMFLDGDDFLHPQAMEVAIEAIRRANTDVCQFGYQEVQVDENIKPKVFSTDYKITMLDEPVFDYIKRRSVSEVLVWNKIYKTALAKSVTFYPISPGEDDVYSLQIMMKTPKLAIIEPALVYYVQNPKSIMHTISEERKLENSEVLEKYVSEIMKDFVAENYNSEHHKEICQYLRNTERTFFKNLFIKPMKKGISRAELMQKYAQYKERIAKGEAYVQGLKLKHRVFLWALDKQYYKLAELLYH